MRVVLCFLSMMVAAQASWAQSQPIKSTPVRLAASNAILMEPVNPGSKSHIAIVYTYPGTSMALSIQQVNNLNDPTGPQLAGRGYREILLNHAIAGGSKTGYESIV